MKTKNVLIVVLALGILLSLGCIGTSQDTGPSDSETIAGAVEESSGLPTSLPEEETDAHIDEENHPHESDQELEHEHAEDAEDEHVEEEMHDTGHVHDEIPAEYTGFSSNPYWNEKISEYETAMAEGKEIYEANCIKCHGPNGLGEIETYLPGVANLADKEMTDDMTTEFWYWRISEGIPETPMTMWKNVLTPDQIWKVMVYEHSFSHDEPPIHGSAIDDHEDEHEH
jgi:mono/diheme cytochrome c family protein